MPTPGHRISPYLSRGLTVDRPNQVWAMNITDVPMARGFVYLAAIIVLRGPQDEVVQPPGAVLRVLSWRLSITMEADFCVEALEEALARHGRPDPKGSAKQRAPEGGYRHPHGR